MRLGFLLLFFASTTLPCWAQAKDGKPIATIVSDLVTKEIDSGRGVGMTVAVAKGNEIIHQKGYGLVDLENSVPASEKSVYRIGSITKMFTAAAILLLVEDGKVNLDDPITEYLPEYPSGAKVTIRHLLNHTSGIVSFTSLPDHRAGMRKDRSHEETLARFKDKPLEFPPGEKFSYCNSGYYLLGMVIEIASEKTYEEFLQERIFDPLKLDSTHYDHHLKIIPNRARGYSIRGEKKINAPYVSMKQPFAAGALVSTTRDLIKWQRGLVENKLLRPDSYKQMIQPGLLNDGKKSKYGLGCFVEILNGHVAIRHGGGIPGFLTELAYFPEIDLTVIVLCNSNRVSPRKMANKIALSLLR